MNWTKIHFLFCIKYLFTTYPNVLPTIQIELFEQTILDWTILHKFPACIAAWKHFMLIINNWVNLFCCCCCHHCKGAFTPDANEALHANYLHVKSMQRRDRNPAELIVRITRRELSVWGVWRASWKIWALADIRAALTNQELALAVTSLRAEAENPKPQWRTN